MLVHGFAQLTRWADIAGLARLGLAGVQVRRFSSRERAYRVSALGFRLPLS
jgi:hypothetical protein